MVQYEISPNRRIETPSGDELPDLVGPGRGDVYYGEGWTLSLQNKNRLGVKGSFADKTNLDDAAIAELDGGTVPDALSSRFTTLSTNSTVEVLQEGKRLQIDDPDNQMIYDAYIVPDTGGADQLYIRELTGDAIATFNIQDRTNQYIYTVRDIENIITDLNAAGTNESLLDSNGSTKPDSQLTDDQKKRKAARDNWQQLLNDNLAYVWNKDYVPNLQAEGGATFEDFRGDGRVSLPQDDSGQFETLVFSAGPAFEYSRTIFESQVTSYSTGIEVGTSAETGNEFGAGVRVFSLFSVTNLEVATGAALSITTAQAYGAEWESGEEFEQTVGFVLQDDDIGDNLAVRVYEDPRWGTPLFFQEPGSITSDPWESGTNKAVDVILEFPPEEEPIKGTESNPFDYHAGAHYRFKVRYPTTTENPNLRELESSGVGFILYAPATDNPGGVTVHFNGSSGSYPVELSRTAPEAVVPVSIYPPEIDKDKAEPNSYDLTIVVEEEADSQIGRSQALTVTFADLQAPRATIISPYEGQRVSPAVFHKADAEGGISSVPFKVEVATFDRDVAKIQLDYRTKDTSGVWGLPKSLAGMTWFSVGLVREVDLVSGDFDANLRGEFEANGFSSDAVVTINEIAGASDARWNIMGQTSGEEFTAVKAARQINIYPDYVSVEAIPDGSHRYTFEWTPEDDSLGAGEYQLRAVSRDNALGTDNTPKPNIDRDPPAVTFLIDNLKPSVLNTTPDYQAKESDRIYRGELNVTFTDDMRADDFSDSSLAVTDLQDDTGDPKVGGFVSYSPALRKVTFVPKVPFKPNGFFKVRVKTDLHDLAGNPLDNEFSWTFRTTDSPFEETWTITLAATDGASTDGNNIAGLAHDAEDGDDALDAPSPPPPSSTDLRLSFLNRNLPNADNGYDRDFRKADGRLSHHWFFVIENTTTAGQPVTIRWKPSQKLVRSPELRHYKMLSLAQFDKDGVNLGPASIHLDPSLAKGSDGLPIEVDLYTYTPAAGETERYFRLDVQKASMIATAFEKGSGGWKFFALPITPERSDPFVNLGDDFDPLKLYRYNTTKNGYEIYPAADSGSVQIDVGRVTLKTGHGYLTRLDGAVEIDVGGTPNQSDMTVELDAVGWHAIGNPFVQPVNVADLKVTNGTEEKSFADAADASTDWIEAMLHRWKVEPSGMDTYEDTTASDSDSDPNNNQLKPWEGYWLKTKEANFTLTIPAPQGVGLDLSELGLPDSFTPPAAPTPVISESSLETTGKSDGFSLRLALTSDVASDLTTSLGTRTGASVAQDGFDFSEPPTFGQTVSLYFDHADWRDASGLYNTDYQPRMKPGESRTWRLTVFTDKRDAKMKLSWRRGIRSIPDDMMLYIRRMQPLPQPLSYKERGEKSSGEESDIPPPPRRGDRGEVGVTCVRSNSSI